MKDNLLVTIADEKYLDQAKQLFSSAYWNGKWAGDYMLITYRVAEKKLQPFKEKGIIVKNIEELFMDVTKYQSHTFYPPVVLLKFYLFQMEFKRWQHIVFLDSDIIVKANINELSKINGFGAKTDMLPFIENQIDEWAALETDPKVLKSKAFNSGVFCFSTDIIEEKTFSEICALAKKYFEKTIYYPDQAILNLFFYKKWKEIPFFFNLYYVNLPRKYKKNPSLVKCAILHFAGEHKPWYYHSAFYDEWKKNLTRWDDIVSVSSVANVNSKYYFGFDRLAYYRHIYQYYKTKLFYLLHKLFDKLIHQLGIFCGYFAREIFLGPGWYEIEYNPVLKKHFIWNSYCSEIFISSNEIRKLEIDLLFSPSNKKSVVLEIITHNKVSREIYYPQKELLQLSVDIPRDVNVRVKITNGSFMPIYAEPNSQDIRKLGVMLLSPLVIHKKDKKIAIELKRLTKYKYVTWIENLYRKMQF